jgi:streptogramin lyase
MRIALALTFAFVASCGGGTSSFPDASPQNDGASKQDANGSGAAVGTGGGATGGAGGTTPDGALGSNGGGTAGSPTGGTASTDASIDTAGSGGQGGASGGGDASPTDGASDADPNGDASDGALRDSAPPAEECPREFEVPTAAAHPLNIAAGPDGNVWFTEAYVNKIGRISPEGAIVEFGPTSPTPWSLTAGPDGALWYTAINYARSPGWIGRINTAGEITERLLDPVPGEITTGPGNNIWFTYLIGKVGTMTLDGQVTSYDLPSTDGAAPSELVGITSGADGNLWFVLQRGNAPREGSVVRVTAAGEMTEFPLPNTIPPPGPLSIVAGPDGALWFTEAPRGIGRITTDGAWSEYLADIAGNYVALAFALDGSIWVTDYQNNRVGRMSRSGIYAWIQLPHAKSGPNDIALGPDGNIWFTERLGNRIGRMAPECLR